MPTGLSSRTVWPGPDAAASRARYAPYEQISRKSSHPLKGRAAAIRQRGLCLRVHLIRHACRDLRRLRRLRIANALVRTRHDGGQRASSCGVALQVGGCKPGERSQSLMCEAVSANRARLRSSSRAVPGGSASAAVRKRSASSTSSSSKLWVRLKRRRRSGMALLPVSVRGGSATGVPITDESPAA
jgi:hypothetical protein